MRMRMSRLFPLSNVPGGSVTVGCAPPALALLAIALVAGFAATAIASSFRPMPTTATEAFADGEHATVDGPVHNGVELTVDLPAKQHVRNFGAPADGKGLCVFASLSMASRWHHIPELMDVIHKLREGGGWPEKVDQTIKQYAPGLEYVQYEGTDPAVLDQAMAEDRAVCVTYGYGERYRENGQQVPTIYHMVMLVHLDGESAAILDNNFPATYEWMPRREFLRRWVHPDGRGWAVVLLRPPPPPPPHN